MMRVVSFDVALRGESGSLRRAVRRLVSRHAVRRALGRAVAALGEWRRRNRGRLELAKLDQRMLRDIGLSRVDAWHEINKPFWRE